MDARLNPYGLLGLEEGDAHVIRNASGVITDDEIRSLAISQRLLGTEEIVLIHHTDCGMLTFTDDEFRRSIQDETGIKPEWAAEAFPDVDEDLRQSLARVNASPFIPKKDSVRGFVYEVESGRLREVKRGPGARLISRISRSPLARGLLLPRPGTIPLAVSSQETDATVDESGTTCTTRFGQSGSTMTLSDPCASDFAAPQFPWPGPSTRTRSWAIRSRSAGSAGARRRSSGCTTDSAARRRGAGGSAASTRPHFPIWPNTHSARLRTRAMPGKPD